MSKFSVFCLQYAFILLSLLAYCIAEKPYRPYQPIKVSYRHTAVVWSCLPFIRSGQNHLARHSERGKKTRQTKEEVGRQHQGMDRPGVCRVPEGSGEQGKMEKTGCKIICGAPMTLVVKGWMRDRCTDYLTMGWGCCFFLYSSKNFSCYYNYMVDDKG